MLDNAPDVSPNALMPLFGNYTSEIMIAVFMASYTLVIHPRRHHCRFPSTWP